MPEPACKTLRSLLPGNNHVFLRSTRLPKSYWAKELPFSGLATPHVALATLGCQCRGQSFQ